MSLFQTIVEAVKAEIESKKSEFPIHTWVTSGHIIGGTPGSDGKSFQHKNEQDVASHKSFVEGMLLNSGYKHGAVNTVGNETTQKYNRDDGATASLTQLKNRLSYDHTAGKGKLPAHITRPSKKSSVIVTPANSIRSHGDYNGYDHDKIAGGTIHSKSTKDSKEANAAASNLHAKLITKGFRLVDQYSDPTGTHAQYKNDDTTVHSHAGPDGHGFTVSTAESPKKSKN